MTENETMVDGLPAETELIKAVPEVKPAFERNELNQNSRGGTELLMERLFDALPFETLQKYQIIPSRVRSLDPNRLRVLYLHDLAGDPEAKAAIEMNGSWTRFNRLVFVSHWQRQQFFNTFENLQWSRTTVIQNSIVPIPTHKKPTDGKINLIYHTTPHRGLNILLATFKKLWEKDQDIHLDVYSSFEIYGWGERDTQFKDMFKEIEDHPGMTYHGFKDNGTVRKALEKAHIFAYPSIWPETSCIALIEAMSAGCYCVHPDYAALPETSGNWTMMYPWHENIEAHAGKFMGALQVAIEMARENLANASHGTKLNSQIAYANLFHNWEIKQTHWKAFLQSFANESTEIQSNYKSFLYQA